MKDGLIRRVLEKGRKNSVKGLSRLGLGKIEALRSLSASVQSQLKTDFVEVQGHKMHLDSEDSLGLSFSPIYEPIETAIVNKEIRAGMVVLDIGANIGYYTLLLARKVGRSGRVYSYEPDPINFGILRRNVEINNYQDNVILSQVAVSDKTGIASLYLSEKNKGDHRIYASKNAIQHIEIDTIRLDDQNIPRVDFIKMDIQGAEGLALAGMRQLIARQDKITIMTEFWPEGLRNAGTSVKHISKMIQDMGFKIYNINERSGLIELVDASQLLDSIVREYGYTNLLLTKGFELAI